MKAQWTFRSFQDSVDRWIKECFGGHGTGPHRAMRFGEEALELMQSCGLSKQYVLRLVNYVYGRPVGLVRQEIGGVLTTLASLSTQQDHDLGEVCEEALEDCWTRIDQIREKQKLKLAVQPESEIGICTRGPAHGGPCNGFEREGVCRPYDVRS